MSTYTYEVISVDEGFLARCIELGVEALGDTEDDAVTNLRRALADKLNANDAVAPAAGAPIAFELVRCVERPAEPFGPGDPLLSLAAHPSMPR